MPTDLRVRYDEGVRRRAAEMFAEGSGYRATAGELGLPPTAVRKRPRTYAAIGLEGLLSMGGSYRSCSWEVKVAAAKAVVDGAELARSTHYYALSHPRGPARPELRDAAAEIFSRTANGCGHRRIAMCLRAGQGAVVADKTVREMMHQSLAA